jgi:hypothetical protein
MKLFSTNPNVIEYNTPSTGSEFLDTWKKGDFLKKTAHYLEDSLEKDLLVCKIAEVQEKEWPSVEIYQKKIDNYSRELSNHIGTHEDPFIIK